MHDFQGYFPGLSRTLSFNFQDFPGGVGNLHCFFYTFYFRSVETVRRERHVSQGSEQLQVSAHVKKLAAGFEPRSLRCPSKNSNHSATLQPA